MRRYGRGSQLAAVLIVITGVAVLATLAFLVSYPGARQIALTAGISPALAGLYPVITDAVLVVACVAALALRGAAWWQQLYAWLSMFLLVAAIAAVSAVHAAGVSLSHRPAAATMAALPWGLFLLGFGLWLSMLRHLRTAPAQGPEGALWWPWNPDPDPAAAAETTGTGTEMAGTGTEMAGRGIAVAEAASEAPSREPIPVAEALTSGPK
jgi:hypothetical protein